MKDDALLCGFFVVFVLFVAGVRVGGSIATSKLQLQIEEIGNSICEEEYNLTFDKYVNGTLYCKHIPQITRVELLGYDGIKVNIKEREVD